MSPEAALWWTVGAAVAQAAGSILALVVAVGVAIYATRRDDKRQAAATKHALCAAQLFSTSTINCLDKLASASRRHDFATFEQAIWELSETCGLGRAIGIETLPTDLLDPFVQIRAIAADGESLARNRFGSRSPSFSFDLVEAEFAALRERARPVREALFANRKP